MTKTKDFKVDFIGVGTPRAATTWVSTCLREHPEICFSKIKEVNFFNYQRKYNRGLKYYKSYFYDTNKILGEISVSYMYDPKAVKRIKKHFPQAKIIASLRNPADMVYSLYWYVEGRRNEKYLSFEKEFVNKNDFFENGFYYQGLKSIFNNFNKDKVKIILYKDIIDNPVKVIKDLYSFLEVNHEFKPDSLKEVVNSSRRVRSKLLWKMVESVQVLHKKGFYFDFLRKMGIHKKIVNLYENINSKNRKYPPMKSQTRRKLIDYYKKDIEKTAKLINRDLSHWLK